MKIVKLIAMLLVTAGAFAATSCCNKSAPAPAPAPTYIAPAK